MFFAFFLTLLFAAQALASPVPSRKPTSASPDPSRGVSTPVGFANGTVLPSGVVRFAVRYATSSRWKVPVPVTAWKMPNNDPTALPPWCPQSSADPGQYSEDCLFIILYVPIAAAASSSSLNTFLWVHGGSFTQGSATYPGLDGSNFALSSKSIVATVQYRLGVLGFLPPPSLNPNTNLGVRDVTEALKFLHKVLPSFGGDVNQITVAGQSSGAMLVRALLAAPTAAALFKNAILHSDPMFYNFQPKSAYEALQSSFYSSTSCTSAALSCLNQLSIQDILTAQDNLVQGAGDISPAAGTFEPLRPSVDGTFITTSLSGSSYPSSLKPVIVTTVANEAGLIIGAYYPPGFPSEYYSTAVEGTFGADRSQILLSAPYYNPQSLASLVPGSNDETREALELMGTDASWRCSSWSFVRSYAAKGGNVHVGLFKVGATYAGTEGNDYCTENGRVCHQDDIYITFGTTPSPNSAQATLTTEIQTRWSSFMHTSNPNPTSSSYGGWNAATSTTIHALQFGAGGGEAAEQACTPTFWGDEVLYDWQIYGVN